MATKRPRTTGSDGKGGGTKSKPKSQPRTGKTPKGDMPLYPISIAAELVGATDQTLRLYEKHGLVEPARRNKNRYYSDNDVEWIRCVRTLIHDRKISIEGVKKLLEYAPCWEIKDCPEQKRSACSAFIDRSKPCWELARTRCKNGIECDTCVVRMAALKDKRHPARA